MRAAAGDEQRSRRECGCSKRSSAASEVTDCTQYALQWLREILGLAPSLCLLKPPGEEALFTVGGEWTSWHRRLAIYGFARRLEQSARRGPDQPAARTFSAPRIRARTVNAARRRPSRTRRFTSFRCTPPSRITTRSACC